MTLPILQAFPTEAITQFFMLGFGGPVLAGIVILIGVAWVLFKLQVPMVGVVPLFVIVFFALSALGGIFESLWVIFIMVCLGVFALGIYKFANQ